MISKGNQRSGGRQLASHLLNAHDNERVEVAEVRGSIAGDVHGAFAEWNAQARATQCTKYLYSLSVNPDQRQGHLSRDQYLDFLARVEKRLGLEGRGRVVVFHAKRDKGGTPREHCHAVWSRIDADVSKAVNIAFDRQKLREVARDFALTHGLELPPGMQEDRGAQRHDDRACHADLQEKQQEERTGITKPERMAALTQAWKTTADGKSFAAAIQNAGYVLARGDKRSYVVIDRAGEIHALARQIEGAKTAEIKTRLSGSHPIESLPSVDEARQEIASRRERLRALMPAAPVASPQPRQPTAEERRAKLAAMQATRRQPIETARAAMQQRQAEERQALSADRRLTASFAQARERRPRQLGVIMRRAASKIHERRQDKAIERRHKAEARELSRQERNLTALEKRERHSLEGHLKRDDFQKLAREIKRRDAVLEHPGVSRQNNNRQPEKVAMPSMSPAERRSRLHGVFSGAKTASLPQPTRAERASALLREFTGATVPEPPDSGGMGATSAAAEAERLRELERQRLEALRHER